MARNRRKVDGEVTLLWIGTRLLLFILLVGFLLGMTLLKGRCLKLGDELAVVDRDLKQAQDKTKYLEAQLARYKTPRELEAKIAYWRLGLVRPTDAQKRWVKEPDISDGVIRPRILAQADSISSTSPSPR